MKDFLKNFKIPIILGGLALIAIIATIVIVTNGLSSDAGLYITSASGSVSITNSDSSENAATGTALKESDVITVGEDSSCTITYKGKKNSENNYIILGAGTQAVVSGEFNGRDDDELFIRNGSVLANCADSSRSGVIIRTADSTITLKDSVSKISYSTNEFISYTDIYTFMGSNTIQLYDPLGNTINSPEYQYEQKWGRIISEEMPSFENLNNNFDLSELTASDLRNLITIANLIGESFPYTVEELKAVLDTKEDDVSETEPPVSEPEINDNSGTIQTAEPLVTTVPEETTPPPTATTLPGQHTTAAPQTQPPAKTETLPTQTTSATVSSERAVHIVTVVIDGEESIQEVLHGDDAIKPPDPVIDGMTFVGWDKSFENITEDVTITAIFNEGSVGNNNGSTTVFHTVTIVIGDRTSTLTVADGQSAELPYSVDVPGYIFKGWDKDFTNITSDITITAILEKANTHTVTFVVEGNAYPVQVEHGQAAEPPIFPVSDSNGNRFVGWDKTFGNITSDMTITAVFEDDSYHNVTFIIDGQFYYSKVKDGEAAEPPFWPITDSNNNKFIGWDRDFSKITDDTVITAIYG